MNRPSIGSRLSSRQSRKDDSLGVHIHTAVNELKSKAAQTVQRNVKICPAIHYFPGISENPAR